MILALLACTAMPETSPAPPVEDLPVPPEHDAVDTLEPVRFSLRTPDDILAVRDAVRPYRYNETSRPPPVVIELPGGILKEEYNFQLGEVGDPNLPDITLLGNGSTLTRGVVSLIGRNITIRDLVIGGERPYDDRITLYAKESLTLDHVAITNLAAPDTGPGSRAMRGVELIPLGPTTRLTVRDSLLLDNRHPLAVSDDGPRGRFVPARFERVRLGGNVAPAVHFGVVERVEFVDSVRLGSGGALETWSPTTLLLSEPADRPEDAATLAAWRAEVRSWGARPP